MEALSLRWVNGWSWLKKPKVLRFVCLASSVVGLICYVLSSSFNHLLGNRIWWKMLLYIVFSFIICLAVFFTKARSSSTSLRLEAHLAFLVLIVTSVYSFLFDNGVKGKPDAYSLISCAAFATMSLGLSNLTQLGFQIDLLYFFCGILTVQLMKINMWLVIVGGGFSYSLLQLRYYPRETQGENLQLQVQNQITIHADDLESQMSQEANADVDSSLGTSPEDAQDHLLTQSNSHPQDDGEVQHPEVNSVMDALPPEIMWRRIMNGVKLISEQAYPNSKGKIRPQIDIFDAPQVHIFYENLFLKTTERIATLYNSDVTGIDDKIKDVFVIAGEKLKFERLKLMRGVSKRVKR